MVENSLLKSYVYLYEQNTENKKSLSLSQFLKKIKSQFFFLIAYHSILHLDLFPLKLSLQ